MTEESGVVAGLGKELPQMLDDLALVQRLTTGMIGASGRSNVSRG